MGWEGRQGRGQQDTTTTLRDHTQSALWIEGAHRSNLHRTLVSINSASWFWSALWHVCCRPAYVNSFNLVVFQYSISWKLPKKGTEKGPKDFLLLNGLPWLPRTSPAPRPLGPDCTSWRSQLGSSQSCPSTAGPSPSQSVWPQSLPKCDQVHDGCSREMISI